ncbi:MAG: phosphoadenylyl-sulfate reductase [Candidatus Acidiferrales bacterium]
MVEIKSQLPVQTPLPPTVPQPVWRDAETKTLLLQMGTASWTAEQTLRWGFTRFGRDAAVVSAFGPEGLVLIDLASRIHPGFRLISIDTEFLFAETYALMEQVERRYGLQVERIRSALSPEQQAREHGDGLWRYRPDRCCEMRKVEPLRRKLVELRAWASGIRRDQTSARATARRVEWDSKFGLWKLNPLLDWTLAQVWEYIRAHDVPYNPLHDANYPSIGCVQCTQPVQPGEDLRAGRWAGFEKTECGLHERS